MQQLVIDMMNRFGYFGISLLIMVENLFPPIPSEVILTFGGFMTIQSELNIIAVIVYSTIGSVAGAIILYLLGRLLNADRLGMLVDKYGRFLHLKRENIQKAQVWFTKRGSTAVLLCRFVPIVRSLISIPAGMAKMDFTLFMIYTVIGTVIWNAVLVCLGAAAGNNWEAIVSIFKKYSKVAVLVLFVVIIICVFNKIRKNKQKSQ